jgi:FkbM family methyltransferase
VSVGATVLDLGAHIGLSALWFLRAGAGGVIAVEPEQANLALLRRNVEGWPVEIVEGAVAERDGTADLYVSQTKGQDTHSLVTKGRKVPRPVRTIALGGLLDEYKPEVIKFDIEYTEYELSALRSPPDYVRILAGELHLNRDREAGPRFDTDLLSAGFRHIRVPRFTPKGWNTYGVWAR